MDLLIIYRVQVVGAIAFKTSPPDSGRSLYEL